MVRLMRRTIKRIGINSVEGKPIVDYCKKTLIKLLPKIDTLNLKTDN